MPVVAHNGAVFEANSLATHARMVDPCVDFFEFTCGNWKAKHPIPSDKTSHSQFHVLGDKIQAEMRAIFESDEVFPSKSVTALKALYHRCMDIDTLNRIGARKLIETIRSFGEWPMLEGNKWRADQFDLTTLFINNAAVRGVQIFINIDVAIDSNDVSRRILQFDQGETGLSREFYCDKERYGKIITAYRRFLINKVKLLHEDANLPVNAMKIASDVDEIIKLETELAKIVVAEEDRSNHTEMYNLRRLSDMQKLMPLVDWNRYFHFIAPFSIHSYLDNDPQILITEMDFLKRVTNLINSTDPRTITNYAYLSYTSAWDGELELSKSQAAKNVTLEMVRDLQDAFYSMVVESDWMDKTTKARALEKAEHMLPQIGYPDFILDNEKLDDYYSGDTLPEKITHKELFLCSHPICKDIA
ncbi:hypothetical protein KIN20_006228 [Parelaphostrongylus tenuis]|uniref:Peptidase M13 N-terminal domain-containing protein n=1 Tax=Parelaphostrongylus tenuis TaxID=148309 RepID=A0AAD5M4F7_PARTN|nr:hypothetical protein KIN20_006228 [Parelaphostrongylus tenuis]